MDEKLKDELVSCYEELIWLSNRPYVSPARARAWYGIRREAFKTRLCAFTGMVSENAANNADEKLVLEHHNRINSTISKLLRTHVELNILNPDEFLATVLKCESVNITTDKENHQAKKAKGDYGKAGITLLKWSEIDPDRQKELWKKKLRGHVANADDYRPNE